MVMRSWKDKKDYICKLIKQISDLHGGDDPNDLEEYCTDVIKKYSNDLETAIRCFEDVLNKSK